MASMNGTQASRASMGSHDRKLRYRGLLEDCTALVEDEASNNMEIMDKTIQVVREAQALLDEGYVDERIEHPGEGYLDSRVLRATSDLALRCSEAVSSNANTYDRHELATHMRENPEFWEIVFPREAPACGFLFGTFAPTPPEQRPRAPRPRIERQQAAPLKAPEKVDKLQKQEEGSEMVSRVNKFINKCYRARGEPISYFHLVLDPDSFRSYKHLSRGANRIRYLLRRRRTFARCAMEVVKLKSRSVENIYNVSFLVRDAKLKVDLDEETELPFITPVVPQQNEQSSISEENQFIVSLDMQRWQDLIQAFEIRKAMMVLKR